MELIRGLHQLKPRHQGCVLTIGNFDGVHLGHQHILKQLQAQSIRLNLPSVVMTFEPQPMEYFTPELAPARLTRLRDKFVQLAKCHIDRLLCVPFNKALAQMTPQAFIEQLLVEKLAVKFLVVGDDFCFGKDRKGDFQALVEAGKLHGFEVVNTQSFCVETYLPVTAQRIDEATQEDKAEKAMSDDKAQPVRVSSTAIRQALANDQLEQAAIMLGRDYSINGRVSHGRKLGRELGFPTANIPLKRTVSPVSGVYAVMVKGALDDENALVAGVANIGNRPTVHGLRQQLEVHLFDFSHNLYGKQLEVILRHKLRDEQKFASVEQLQTQIRKDADNARHWLAQNQ